MSTSPVLIENLNLSQSWIFILRRITENSGTEISPLILTITDFNDPGNIRKCLNEHLNLHGLQSVETVSETIFPESLYEYVKYDREALYNAYRHNFPRIRKIDNGNRNGTYFERMIAFNNDINQLEIIISSLIRSTVKRRSKLQASIFDPTKDHTNKPFQGFPCLQHVTFYKSENGGLILNSFYAVQYLYRRAYGNWLKLINLGNFVAREAGLELERFNCFIGVEQLDKLNKHEAKQFLSQIDASYVHE